MIAELAVAATIGAAPPPVRFGFEAVSAKAGQRVVLHVDGARSRTVRLYLVKRSVLPKIRSARDSRLFFIATARQRGGHAVVPFIVPPIDSGSYVPWCATCGKRATGVLRIVMPQATSQSCPATTPGEYGNGFLRTMVPTAGELMPGGSIWTKLFWFSTNGNGDVTVTGRRLDAQSPPLTVHRVNRGTDGRSWATPVTFPSAGCWRVTVRFIETRLRFAVNLVYVTRIEGR
jgi:hypothetical protein